MKLHTKAINWIQSSSNELVTTLRTRKSKRITSDAISMTPIASAISKLPQDPEPFVVPEGFVEGGIPLLFPSTRDRYLPAIFVVPIHPQLPDDVLPEIGRILVIPWPAKDPGYNKFFFNYVKNNISIPGGPNATIPATGWGKLLPGDVLFLRDISGSRNPMDDKFGGFLVHPYECTLRGIYTQANLILRNPSSELAKSINNVRDQALGTRAEREELGHTRFEKCLKRAIPVRGEGTCYSLAMSHQKPRNLAGPSAGGKVRGKISEEEQEHVKLREIIVKTVVRIGVHYYQRLVPREYKILEDNAELRNIPRIGTDDNACFTGVQQNLATPQPEEDRPTQIKALAFFGGIHFDLYDSDGGKTELVSSPDIPEGWEGGRFHLVEYGLYAELDGLVVANFSGLRLHGGTPPLAPTGAEIPPWAYRWVVVLYPQGAILDGKVTINISADEDGIPIQLTPRMKNFIDGGFPIDKLEEPVPDEGGDERDPTVQELTLSSNEINMVDDGHIIMTPQAEVDFLARSFYQFLLYHQRRSGMTASGNFETFRHTYSIERDGQFYYPRPWPLAPDGAPLNKDLYTIEPSLLTPRQNAHLQWVQHCQAHRGFTPSVWRNYKAPQIRVPGPRFTGIPSKQAEALRIKRKKVAAHRRKSSKSRKAVAVKISEISDAAQSAPLMVNFESENLENNMKKRKNRKKKNVRSKKAKSTIDIVTEDNDNYSSDVSESDEDADVEFSVKRFISHRVSMDPKHPGYEYLVEWEQDNTESWVHDSLINQGEMYSSYRQKVFTQVLEDKDMEVAANVDHFEYEGLESNDSSTTNTLANNTYTSAFQIPLLLKISENSITSAIYILKDALSSQHETEGISVLRMFQQVQEIHSAIENSPLDAKTMKIAGNAWSLITSLKAKAKVHEAEALILHHTIMLTHYRLYNWVWRCIDASLDNPQFSSWWTHLHKYVTEALDSGKPNDSFNFDSSSFLPQIQPPRIYQWKYRARQRIKEGIRLGNTSLCSEVVFYWLGLPSDSRHSTQSMFLCSLMGAMGNPSIFLLDDIWNAYVRPESYLRHSSSPADQQNLPNGPEITRFMQEVIQHPILGKDHIASARQLFKQLDIAHCQFLNLSPSSASSNGDMLNSFACPATTSIHRISLEATASRSSHVPASLSGVQSRMEFFRDCLLEIALVMHEQYSPSPTKLQQKILTNVDRHCPFRELGPSRVTSRNGAFAPQNINSREGIFSGLVFRGILFNTRALQEHEHSGFFESWGAWESFVAIHQEKGESYMCNPHVYGRTNGRSPRNAWRFWIGSQILHNKLLQEPNITFTNIVNFITTAKGPDSKTLFPTFGILTAYLFTVDLVYAGRIPFPPLKEVSEMISKLDKGGSRGLMKIGISLNGTSKHLAKGFVDLFDFLNKDRKFSSIKEGVIFDPFMLEHSLCKASRDGWLSSFH